ncbi:MAG: DegV family protein [Eubacteriales bacterium]|nr:DegV family protein [Eubacteriales bacterium]
MSYITFTDGSANLNRKIAEGIQILPCDYYVDDKALIYDGDLDHFDYHAYYEKLRNNSMIRTSLLNTQRFIDAFEPVLKEGNDVIYIAMASGISGTYQAAKLAASELMEDYPDRFVHIVDSKTCGLGSGMQAIKSAELSRQGMTATEAASILDEYAEHCCSYFTVDDLNFLKRTGRVSGATALIGTALSIKPILYGTSEAVIVSCEKVRGRKKSITALASIYKKKAINPEENIVYISHGDCEEEANILAEKVRAAHQPKDIVICPHEPFSGAHVGPGMLGIFFYGEER